MQVQVLSPAPKRRCVRLDGLLRFFVFIIYFGFGAIPFLDVCFAYEVLFAIRRPNATNYAMFHPHQARRQSLVALLLIYVD